MRGVIKLPPSYSRCRKDARNSTEKKTDLQTLVKFLKPLFEIVDQIGDVFEADVDSNERSWIVPRSGFYADRLE